VKKVMLEIMRERSESGHRYAGGPLCISEVDVSEFTEIEVSEIIACNSGDGQFCRIKVIGGGYYGN